jgi:diacylglycerol kinase (ATP)
MSGSELMTVVAVVAHRGKSVGGGLEELRDVLAAAGHTDPLWYEVGKSRKAPAKVTKAIAEGADLVLVWGGDGTVQRCAGAVVDADAGKDVALGIVPAGTANLLATYLGVPRDVHEAVEIALSGRHRQFDVGVVNGECFLVMAGTGFDAMMIRDADRGLKDRLGRVAYLWTGVKNLKSSSAGVTVSIDGATWFKGRASCVVAANVGRILGGIELFPEAAVDDGRLDIGVVEARTRLQWLRVMARVVFGRAASSPLVRTTRAEKLVVELDRKLPYQLDGGDRKPTDRVEVTVVPAALRLCAPIDDDSGDA